MVRLRTLWYAISAIYVVFTVLVVVLAVLLRSWWLAVLCVPPDLFFAIWFLRRGIEQGVEDQWREKEGR